MGHEFRYLETAGLRPSPLNPRKRFDEKFLRELSESIAREGVIEPLVVRAMAAEKAGGVSVPAHHEIICGEQRWRAAKLAKQETVPCIVRELDDKSALELMVIENQQRRDVSALEEAEGYRHLMEIAGYDVKAMAEKIGKSESYVYQRLKLNELCDEGKNYLDQGIITAGHAILIARLNARDQQKCLDQCLTRTRGYDKDGEEVWGSDRKSKAVTFDPTTYGTRDLASFIGYEIAIDLAKAPWKLDDKSVPPGSCLNCPKRIEQRNESHCLDGQCYQNKLDVFLTDKIRTYNLKTAEAKPPIMVRVSTEYHGNGGKKVLSANSYRKIAKAADRCASAERAIVAHGEKTEIGRVLDICRDKECKKHQRSYSHSSFDREKWERQQKLNQLRHQTEQEAEDANIEAILAKLDPAKALTDRAILEAVASTVINGYRHDGFKKRHEGKGNNQNLKTPELIKRIVDGALCQSKKHIESVCKTLKLPFVKPKPVKLEVPKKTKSKGKKVAVANAA